MMSNDLLRGARVRTPSRWDPGEYLSRQELAELVAAHVWEHHGERSGLDDKYIGKLERGQIRWPGRRYREALRAILGATTDGELGFKPPRAARRDDAPLDGDIHRSASGEASGQGNVLVIDHVIDPDDRERLYQAISAPHRVDRVVIDSLAAVLAAQRRLEDSIGSEPLIEPVRAQLAIVDELATEASGHFRMKVLKMAAQWAQFCGWLHASMGGLMHANALYDRALASAAEAGDINMISTALNMKGHAAWLGGRVGSTISLSSAAQQEGASPGVRALAAQQEARGHAMVGDEDATMRKLDEAQVLSIAAAQQPDAEPPWAYFFNPDFFAMQRAKAYLYLGRYVEAVELLTSGLHAMPDGMRRSEWVAWYLVDLVRAYGALGEVDEAGKVAKDVAYIAETTGSKRLAAKAAALRR